MIVTRSAKFEASQKRICEKEPGIVPVLDSLLKAIIAAPDKSPSELVEAGGLQVHVHSRAAELKLYRTWLGPRRLVVRYVPTSLKLVLWDVFIE